MEETIEVINKLEQAGTIGRYAIGGAMGALFYTEPILTFDLDVFIDLPRASSGLITLSPIYEALSLQGFKIEKEFVIIHGVPVQFLPVFNQLSEEALVEARESIYKNTQVRVFRAEHLLAIALQTGRLKDQQRARLLLEQAELDVDYLHQILTRHHLETQWKALTPSNLR